jgi:tetratricopeptide (TPR) repeat protein
MPMNSGDRKGLVEAKRLLQSGKLREALARLLHLTEKYPDDAEVREGLAEALVVQGVTHAEKGEHTRAFGEFERSIRYADNAEAHINLGRIHQLKGRFEDAFAEYTRALDLNEDLPAAHEALGHYFVEMRDFDQAASAFGRAISKGGASRSAFLGLWEAYLGLGQHEKAHDTIMEAVSRWPDDDAVLGTAGLSFAVAKDDHGQAEVWWKKAVLRNPRNLAALFNLAGLAALRGDRPEALDYLRKCVQVDRERAIEMWRGDARSPRRKFAAYAGDEDFLDLLGI